MNSAAKSALWALPVAVIVALWLWQPWAARVSAVRPDTGETVARLEGDALHPVLSELLRRVYSAFGEEEEFAIYDGLSSAVASDLLTDLYLQRRAAQEQEYSDGGKVTIREVEITDLIPLPAPENTHFINTSWTVRGLVEHGEHQHERINSYTAKLELGIANGEWRLTGFNLDTIRREEPEPLFFEGFDDPIK